MKVVKLNKRNIGWKHGFTHALRFDWWDSAAARTEELLFKTYNTACYDKKGPYYSYFGRTVRRSIAGPIEKPYWINLRYEADITLILLNGITVGER